MGEGCWLCVSTCFAHLLFRTNLTGHRLQTGLKALHFYPPKNLIAALLLLYNCKNWDWDYDDAMHAGLIRIFLMDHLLMLILMDHIPVTIF